MTTFEDSFKSALQEDDVKETSSVRSLWVEDKYFDRIVKGAKLLGKTPSQVFKPMLPLLADRIEEELRRRGIA